MDRFQSTLSWVLMRRFNEINQLEVATVPIAWSIIISTLKPLNPRSMDLTLPLRARAQRVGTVLRSHRAASGKTVTHWSVMRRCALYSTGFRGTTIPSPLSRAWEGDLFTVFFPWWASARSSQSHQNHNSFGKITSFCWSNNLQATTEIELNCK